MNYSFLEYLFTAGTIFVVTVASVIAILKFPAIKEKIERAWLPISVAGAVITLVTIFTPPPRSAPDSGIDDAVTSVHLIPRLSDYTREWPYIDRQSIR